MAAREVKLGVSGGHGEVIAGARPRKLHPPTALHTPLHAPSPASCFTRRYSPAGSAIGVTVAGMRGLLLGLVIVFCVVIPGCAENEGSTKYQKVRLGGREFKLELAVDTAARHQGLSDRESVSDDGGMLFVFPDVQVLRFVMRRCLVPIDIVFLGPGGRIMAMHGMEIESYETPEEKLRVYSSRWPGQFAIELKGGTLKTLGLKRGMKVELPVAELKQIAQ